MGLRFAFAVAFASLFGAALYAAQAQTRNCHQVCRYNPITHSTTCDMVCF
jgi:spore coat protein CotF